MTAAIGHLKLARTPYMMCWKPSKPIKYIVRGVELREEQPIRSLIKFKE
jgi:hypothetical protein